MKEQDTLFQKDNVCILLLLNTISFKTAVTAQPERFLQSIGMHFSTCSNHEILHAETPMVWNKPLSTLDQFYSFFLPVHIGVSKARLVGFLVCGTKWCRKKLLRISFLFLPTVSTLTANLCCDIRWQRIDLHTYIATSRSLTWNQSEIIEEGRSDSVCAYSSSGGAGWLLFELHGTINVLISGDGAPTNTVFIRTCSSVTIENRA